MAKKKLSPVQDIPGMKIYDGPDGPEVYVTDPDWFKGKERVNLILEAKINCVKVRITYREAPDSNPKTIVVQPIRLIQSANGWRMTCRASDDAESFEIWLNQVTRAELTDIHFEPEELVF